MKFDQNDIILHEQYNFEIFTCDQLAFMYDDKFTFDPMLDVNIDENQELDYTTRLRYKSNIFYYLELVKRVDILIAKLDNTANNTGKPFYSLMSSNAKDIAHRLSITESKIKSAIGDNNYLSILDDIMQEEKGKNYLRLFNEHKAYYTTIANEVKNNHKVNVIEAQRNVSGIINQLYHFKKFKDLYSYITKDEYLSLIDRYEKLENYLLSKSRTL